MPAPVADQRAGRRRPRRPPGRRPPPRPAAGPGPPGRSCRTAPGSRPQPGAGVAPGRPPAVVVAAERLEQVQQERGPVDGRPVARPTDVAVATGSSSRVVDTLSPIPTTAAATGRPLHPLDQDAGQLGLAEQDVVGPLEPDLRRRRRGVPPRATETPASSGSHGHRATGTSSGREQHRQGQRRAAAASPRSGPAGRGRRSGARRATTRPSALARPGPGRRRRRSWTATPRPPRPATPAGGRRRRSGAVERRSVGAVRAPGRGGSSGRSVTGTRLAATITEEANEPSERSSVDDRPGTPGQGTEVPADIDIHTTAGKAEDLSRRLEEAVHAGSARAVEKQHAQGQEDRPGADRGAARRGLVRRARRARPAPVHRLRAGAEPALRRRRGHRLRHGRRAARCASSPRTSRSSAARSARSSARRSSRSWTWR